jgi:pimeloyl-ACP methyl ester carboxylesterase
MFNSLIRVLLTTLNISIGANLVLAAELLPQEKTKPIVMAEQGYFFVNGNYIDVGNKKLMANQMYVQYMTPKVVKHRYPIVMIHGTAQTGNNFLGTPDGRRGWADYFVAQGYKVFVVDQVGRARSGDSAEIYGPYARFGAQDLELVFTGQEKFNLFPQAKLHTQWPGGPGVIGNAAFDQFYAQQDEFIASAVKTEELMYPADVALLEKIGPAIVLTHSQSGVFGWKLADARPDLVKAHVAVEPNGPPFFDVNFLGGENWYKDSDNVGRAWGITRIPLNYDPPAANATELKMVRQEKSDSPELIRCWLQAEPARQLPNMKNTPTVIVTGEASFRATLDHCTSKFLSQAGVKNKHIRLENEGVKGNGHMMMLEKNSDQVAQVIEKWINSNVK